MRDTKHARLLIIDDQDHTVEMCQRQLPELAFVTRCGKAIPCRVCEERDKGCTLRSAHDWNETEAALSASERLPDLVLLDLHFALPVERLLPASPDDDPRDKKTLERWRRGQGEIILGRLRARYPELPIILLTTQSDAVERGDRLLYLCQNEVVDSRSLAAEILRALGDSSAVIEDRVYWGKGLQGVRAELLAAARSPLPLLLEGETGTGKSFLAEHIVHARSGRKGACVVTDLSTIPDGLLSAHLFGARRGAYTGASEDTAGVFEQAHGGTLFIDEIANASLEVQKQLLLVLERGSVVRLGDVRARPAVCKVVAATQTPLSTLVQRGVFRRDLYMRLNPAGRIALPPLRARRDELPALFAHAVEQALASPFCRELCSAFLARYPTPAVFDATHNVVRYGPPRLDQAPADAFAVFVSTRGRERLLRHAWPGNMRELTLLALNVVTALLDEALRAEIAASRPAPAVLVVPDALVQRFLSPLDEPAPRSGISVQVAQGASFARISADVEKQYLLALLSAADFDLDALGKRLFGADGAGRRVRLRLNQLGVKLRELPGREVSRHARHGRSSRPRS